LVATGEIAGASLNVACPFSVPVLDIVRAFEGLLGRTARFDAVMAGIHYDLDTNQTQAAAAQIGLVFDAHYVECWLDADLTPAPTFDCPTIRGSYPAPSNGSRSSRCQAKHTVRTVASSGFAEVA